MKRIAVVASTVAVGGLAFAGLIAPTSAQADPAPPSVSSVTLSPSVPVMRPGKLTTVRVTVVFKKDSSQSIDNDSDPNWIVFQTTDGGLSEVEDLVKSTATATTETWRATVKLDGSATLGRQYVGVRYSWSGQTCENDPDLGTICTPTGDFDSLDYVKAFNVKGATTLTANAAPEPIRKGGKFTVSGKLKTITPYQSTYAGYGGQTVRIYFDPKGPKKAYYVGKAKTKSTGKYTKTFKAKKDGTWSARYAGNAAHLARTSAGDYLNVT